MGRRDLQFLHGFKLAAGQVALDGDGEAGSGDPRKDSIHQGLGFFLVFLSFLSVYGLKSWPVSQFTEKAFPNGGIISEMILLWTGLSHLQKTVDVFR